jgi:hypothetical protein
LFHISNQQQQPCSISLISNNNLVPYLYNSNKNKTTLLGL